LQANGQPSLMPPFPATDDDAVLQPQLRSHLDASVPCLCALGGGGTIRSLATALIGRNMPLGIVPLGTANLPAALPVLMRAAN
jgi:predicted polyphosphate/ATP-dependent NAD kinase